MPPKRARHEEDALADELDATAATAAEEEAEDDDMLVRLERRRLDTNARMG